MLGVRPRGRGSSTSESRHAFGSSRILRSICNCSCSTIGFGCSGLGSRRPARRRRASREFITEHRQKPTLRLGSYQLDPSMGGRTASILVWSSSPRSPLTTMDRWDSITNALSSVTVYDIKAMYNQVYQPSTILARCFSPSVGKECRPQR